MPPDNNQITVVIIMGVSGAGKTTVGRLLADRLHWSFADADDYHSPANKEKMRTGIALQDSDRAPWLESLAAAVAAALVGKNGLVLACSALKDDYRQRLEGQLDEGQKAAVQFVYLRADFNAIADRLENRHDHYMNKNLLHSQFQTLEEPGRDEAMSVDATMTPEEIVDAIIERLPLSDS